MDPCHNSLTPGPMEGRIMIVTLRGHGMRWTHLAAGAR